MKIDLLVTYPFKKNYEFNKIFLSMFIKCIIVTVFLNEKSLSQIL